MHSHMIVPTSISRVTLVVVTPLLVCVMFAMTSCGSYLQSSAALPASLPPGTVLSYQTSPVSLAITSAGQSPIANQYFGMHIHNLANPALSAAQQTPFPNFPFATMRLWDNVAWISIEPQRGVYNWTRMDDTIQKASANGVSDFIFTFGYVPTWASSDPSNTSCVYAGSCVSPANLSDLDDFTNTLVRRYCGVVRYYETWNEPNGSSFWQGTNEQLLSIAQHVYKSVKDPANCGCTNGSCQPGGGANPNKVLFPPISSPGSTQWLQSWLSYVGNPYPYADIVAFHGYGYTTNPEDIYTGAEHMRSTLAQYGLGEAEIWNTEASWGDVAPSTQGQVSWLIRYHVVQTLSGVSRFTWYAYDNCAWGTLYGGSTCTQTSDAPGPHNASTAYATVEQWLTGATPQACESHEDGTWLCAFTRPGGYVGWIVWNNSGRQVALPTISAPELVQYRDWENQVHLFTSSVTIGSVPILLENKNAV
jgi:polysaccharide biosynthesis protein PslG